MLSLLSRPLSLHHGPRATLFTTFAGSIERSFRGALPAGLLVFLMLAPGAIRAQTDGQASPDQPAEPSLRVEVASGRQFVGQIDPQTDAQHLYLRVVQGPMVLVRPIQWTSIIRAHVAGETVTGAELRSVVTAIRQQYPQSMHPAPPRLPTRAVVTGPLSSATISEPPLVVRSLAVEAWTANWDADVEADGLVVSVYTLDDEGRIAQVDGTLEVELVAPRPGITPDAAPFPQIGRWVRHVSLGDFSRGGPAIAAARYRLEYQAIHPEFDRYVVARGLVHARLSVPGQGTFEAPAAIVRIRSYSAPRDWLEQATGRRFLPNERVGRPIP